MRLISDEYRQKLGKIGPSHLLSEHGNLSFFLVFETVLRRKHSGKVSKNSSVTLIFLMCFCTLLIRCIAVISIVAIIIFWQVYDLGGVLIYPEHHLLRIKMGLHPEGFLRTKRDWHESALTSCLEKNIKFWEKKKNKLTANQTSDPSFLINCRPFQQITLDTSLFA